MKIQNPIKICFLLLISLVILCISCSKDADNNAPTVGSLVLNFKNITTLKSIETEDVSAVYLSIKNSSEEYVYNMQKFTLINFNGGYITENIELLEGYYTIEDFVVVNDLDSAVYVAPKEGSEFASLVNYPLPLFFTVSANNTSSVSVQVIPSDLGDAEKYGYTIFTFEVVDINNTSSLIAYYPFNGNANDVCFQHNGIENGVQLTSDRNGNANSAYFFKGTSNIVIQDHDFFKNLETFSVCVWVYPMELSDDHNTIISKVTPQRDFDLKIRKSDMKYNCRFVYDNPSLLYLCNSEETVKLNTWTHLICQWTGTKFQMYINGELSKEQDETENIPPWTGTIMTIGSMGSSEYFTGKIDDIRIYDKILSNNEMQLIYRYSE